MTRRMIEYRSGEIRSLLARIEKITEMLFQAVDIARARGDEAAAHTLCLDIYYMHGMKYFADVLIDYPDDLYRRLHEETTAVEQTFNRYIKEKIHEQSEIRDQRADPAGDAGGEPGI